MSTSLLHIGVALGTLHNQLAKRRSKSDMAAAMEEEEEEEERVDLDQSDSDTLPVSI